jgi:LysR family transcriptional regulator, glycine cleavage system transcriptional activator
MRLPPLKSVHYFEAAARLQSFTKAAAELNVTHSAISHQIKALEEWLGQPLFERKTRQVRLTEAGKRFIGPVKTAFDQLAEGAAEITRFGKDRPLTVTALPSLSAKWLVPRLSDFQRQHPDIQVRLSATSTVEQIGGRDIDLGIRFGRGQWDSLESELLARNDIFPVCAPGLLTPDKPIREPRDVLDYPLLTDSDWMRSGYDEWSDWLKGAGFPEAKIKSNLSLNYSNLLIQAAIDGLGIAMGNVINAGDDLRHGRLVKPIDFTVKTDTGYFIVYAKNALKQPKIKAFRDWLMEQASGHYETCKEAKVA